MALAEAFIRLEANVNHATSRTALLLSGFVLCAVTAIPANAGPIFLSDYLGGATGTTVETSNTPFTTVIIPASSGGFGVNTLGGFSSGELIAFSDSGFFDKGIGAHPVSSIEFNLAELRNIDSFLQFEAVIGIGPAFGGQNGAQFIIAVDGAEMLRLGVPSIDTSGTAILVPVPIDATTLTLSTLEFGSGGGNHAAWADAKLTVPEPCTALLIVSGAVSLTARRRRRAA